MTKILKIEKNKGGKMDVSVYYRSGGGAKTHRIDVHGDYDHATAIELVKGSVIQEAGVRKAPGSALYQQPFLARIEGDKK